MLPCYSCTFRRDIPGDAHSECVGLHTVKTEKDTFDNVIDKFIEIYEGAGGSTNQLSKWFAWPINFDPTWGPNACSMHQTEKVEVKKNSDITMLSLYAIGENVGLKIHMAKGQLRQVRINNEKAKKPPANETSGSIDL